MMRAIRERVRGAWRALQARRTLWMALGALGFGALSVLGVRNYIGDRLALEKARLAPRPELIEVVVARQELKRGDVVGVDTMAVRAIPKEYAPGGAVLPARFDSVQGMRLQAPMKPGEPLLASALTAPESSAIAQRLAPGVRAMTIAVDEVNSLSGMLQPGDRIDLLLTVRPLPVQGQLMPEMTRTVIQDVPVLATGRQSRAQAAEDAHVPRSYTSITVEVDPERAQKLVVAQRSGKLTAVLRHPDDRQSIADKRLDVNTLLGLPPPSPAPVAQAPAHVAVPEILAKPQGPQIIVGGRGPLQSNAAAPASPTSVSPAPPALQPAQASAYAPVPAMAMPAPAQINPAPASTGTPYPGSDVLPQLPLLPPAQVPLYR